MAKVVLVETAKIVTGNRPRGQYPQGLCLVADALSKNYHEVKIIDGFIEAPYSKRELVINSGIVYEFGMGNEELSELILQQEPDIVGITNMLTVEHSIKAGLVRNLKDKQRDLPVIMGGTAASCNAAGILGFMSPHECIGGIDVILLGRGIGLAEGSAVQVVNTIMNRGSIPREQYFEELAKIPGIAFKNNCGKFVATPYCALDLSNYPYRYNLTFVKQGVIYPDAYSELNNPHAGPTPYPPATELSTSNGCPYQCTFCHIKSFQEQLRTANSENIKVWDRLPLPTVFEELKVRRQLGYNTISFEDDNFFGYTSQQRDEGLSILEFCRQLGFKCIQFPNGVTTMSLLLDDSKALHYLGALAKSGTLIRVAIAIESGSEDTLRRYIVKPHTKTMVVRLLQTMKNEGYLLLDTFQTEAFFVFGNVDPKGNIEPLSNILESQQFLFHVAENYNIPVSVFGCVPNPPGMHYRKFIMSQEKKYGQVKWPEMLFTQVAELEGEHEKIGEINTIIQATRQRLRKMHKLHARTATL